MAVVVSEDAQAACFRAVPAKIEPDGRQCRCMTLLAAGPGVLGGMLQCNQSRACLTARGMKVPIRHLPLQPALIPGCTA